METRTRLSTIRYPRLTMSAGLTQSDVAENPLNFSRSYLTSFEDFLAMYSFLVNKQLLNEVEQDIIHLMSAREGNS